MSAQDYVIVIGASAAGLASIVAAVFAGHISLKQMPRAAARRDEISQAQGVPPKEDPNGS